MKKTESISSRVAKIKNRDRGAIARAITLVESKNPLHAEESFALLDALAPYAGQAIRLGISGTPGVGKSTLIEKMGLLLIEKDKKVAVLTIDPSSTLRFGSILGDKTRMPLLSASENAFIRPSPSLGALGGVTDSTREVMLICEAAGFDVIIVETVGVGQSELAVSSMVDTFILLLQPGSGDELQAVKKGILEWVDILVINKADGDFKKIADQTAREYVRSLRKKPILKTSALHNHGLAELWEAIEKHQKSSIENGNFTQKRTQQMEQWFLELMTKHFFQRLKLDLKSKKEMKRFSQLILAKKISVTHAASQAFRAL